MRKWICLAIVMLSLCLVSCGDTTGNPPGTTDDEMFSDSQSDVQIDRIISIEEISSDEQDETAAEKNLILSIDGKKIDAAWEDNESVTALKKLATEKPLEIQMSKYGGFEQVGPIGAEIPADDEEMTTEAGDIVLYSGNQIVVFYGSNTWDYTKLGHINGKTAEELKQMLGEKDVILTLEEK